MWAKHSSPFIFNRLGWFAACWALAGLLAVLGGQTLQAAATMAPPATPAINPSLQGVTLAALYPLCTPNLFAGRMGGSGGGTIVRDGGVFVNAPPDCNAINSNIWLATTSNTDCPNPDLPPWEPGGCWLTGAYPIQTSGIQTAGITCTPKAYPGGYINWWTAPSSPCNFYPAVQTAVPQILTPTPPITLTDITCGPARSTSGGTLQPGTYADGLNAGNNDVYLMPGVYCITGVGSANKILTARSLTGRGVFIYVQPPNAQVSYDTSTLDLGAAYDGENGLNCQTTPTNPLCKVQGIALFKPNGPNMCNSNARDLDFSGSSSLYLRGMLWAPQSYFSFTGNGDFFFRGQLLTGCQNLMGNGVMDISYEATPLYNTYLITPTAGANGAIKPGTVQTVSYGANLTFTIAPNAGYRIIDVGVDGVSQGPRSTYVFTNVMADHTLTATFMPLPGSVMPGVMAAALNSNICSGSLFTARGGGSVGGTLFRDGGIFVNAPPTCTSAINFYNSGGTQIATTTSAACPDTFIPPDQPGGCIIDGAYPIQVTSGQTGTLPCTPETYPGRYIDWWYSPGSNCNVYPAIQTYVPAILEPPAPITITDIPCGPARTTPLSGTVWPGTYADGLNTTGNSDLYLQPGVYCITGTGSANAILRAYNITGRGVFIYIAVPQARIDYSGGKLDLTAATSCGLYGPSAVPCALLGIALYKPVGTNNCNNNTQDMGFVGGASLYLQGLLWAPQSYFSFAGNGDLSIIGQTFAGCQSFRGNGVMQLDYVDWRQFIQPGPVKSFFEQQALSLAEK